MIRLGALVSGGGRTVLNLQDAIDRGTLDATIDVVVAHAPSIKAVERCQERGLNVVIVEPDADAIDEALSAVAVEIVCLAGYLRKFRIAERWRNHAINIHPSLLPAHGGQGMYGLHVHDSVLLAGDVESGCTVHIADDEYDRGPTLLQRRCAVLPDDTAESLAARVFEEECIALPETLAAIDRGEIPLLRSWR